MASLTHVCMWSEHGWERITAEEAAKLHPGGTVSACSGLFMCELCGQYVTLTDGDKYTRYFRHSASEKDKDCPERSFGAAYRIDYHPENHELPIRITNISRNDFSLELGLLVLPPEIYKASASKSICIKSADDSVKFIYSFERLNDDSITYVSIGSTPQTSYEISADVKTSPYWPATVEGIDSFGTIFDGRTGKKLVCDADVVVDKSYYYLGTHRLTDYAPHVQRHLICEKRISYNTWYIYELQATEFEEDAAKFFLRYHCRLTDSPISLLPVWPPYEKSPYVIKHSTDTMYMHMQGQSGVTAKTFPPVSQTRYPCKGDGSLIRVNCGARQQLISAGRSNVLHFTYLWREALNKVTETPNVKVSDIKGSLIESGIYNSLPDKNILIVDAPFDGTIKLLKNNSIIEIIPLKSGIRTDIRGIEFGIKVQILQGLDIICEIEYSRNHTFVNSNEAEILKKLMSFNGQKIKVEHSLGAAAQYLKEYPKIKLWFYSKIKAGYMDSDAYRYFRHFILTIINK